MCCSGSYAACSSTLVISTAQILSEERKRYARLEAAAKASPDKLLLRHVAETGAHVLAPCPHDGKCPVDGTAEWCHFRWVWVVRCFETLQCKLKQCTGA